MTTVHAGLPVVVVNFLYGKTDSETEVEGCIASNSAEQGFI